MWKRRGRVKRNGYVEGEVVDTTTSRSSGVAPGTSDCLSQGSRRLGRVPRTMGPVSLLGRGVRLNVR